MDTLWKVNLVRLHTFYASMGQLQKHANYSTRWLKGGEKSNTITYNVLLHGYSLEDQFDKVAGLLNSIRHEIASTTQHRTKSLCSAL